MTKTKVKVRPLTSKEVFDLKYHSIFIGVKNPKISWKERSSSHKEV